MAKVTDSMKDKVRRWEEKNIVWGNAYFTKAYDKKETLKQNMAKRGYDAYRVSSRPTSKFGLKYQAVYGGQVEPNYSMKKTYPLFPKAKWYLQGYIKAGKKGGTYLISSLSDLKQTFMIEPLKRQLMLKTTKKKGRR